ncbi:putative glutamate-1-semialdehyde 2,1-aminomutase [Ilyonectria robusta]
MDLVNSQTSRVPVCGIWTSDDITDGEEVFDAEVDEVKFVTEGESLWKDITTGKTVVANKGDMLWFPKGASSILVWSRNLSAFYVEATHRKVSVVTKSNTQLGAIANDLLARLTNYYVVNNPMSKKAFEEAVTHLPSSNPSSGLKYGPFSMVFKSSNGCYITSLDSREYLDFAAEYSTSILGHSHPEITKTIEAAVACDINLGGPDMEEAKLGALLKSRMPSLEGIHFCASEAQARTKALTLACSYTKKAKVIAFTQVCHDGHHEFSDIPTPFDFAIGRYNDIEHTRAMIDDTLAVIIVEPVQVGAGVLPASCEFPQFLRDAADGTNANLIFDEGVTSRLHYGGMQGYHGIKPDMKLLGSCLGGLSLGLFGGSATIMNLLEPHASGHLRSGRSNNSTLSIRAGVTCCEVLTEDIIASTNTLGDRLRDGINQFGRLATPAFVTATGLGSLVGIQFGGSSALELSNAFFFFMLKEGIFIGRKGVLALNMTHRDEHITRALNAVRCFVEHALVEDWSMS